MRVDVFTVGGVFYYLGVCMNKARRHELKMLKFKKRLKQLNLTGKKGKFHSYRSHGAPCSCSVCSPYKYDREKENRLLELTIVSSEEIKSLRNPAYNLLIP